MSTEYAYETFLLRTCWCRLVRIRMLLAVRFKSLLQFPCIRIFELLIRCHRLACFIHAMQPPISCAQLKTTPALRPRDRGLSLRPARSARPLRHHSQQCFGAAKIVVQVNQVELFFLRRNQFFAAPLPAQNLAGSRSRRSQPEAICSRESCAQESSFAG